MSDLDIDFSGQSDKTKIALLIQELNAQAAHSKVQDAAILALQVERNNALIWGVLTLGAATLGLLAWIGYVFFGLPK